MISHPPNLTQIVVSSATWRCLADLTGLQSFTLGHNSRFFAPQRPQRRTRSLFRTCCVQVFLYPFSFFPSLFLFAALAAAVPLPSAAHSPSPPSVHPLWHSIHPSPASRLSRPPHVRIPADSRCLCAGPTILRPRRNPHKMPIQSPTETSRPAQPQLHPQLQSSIQDPDPHTHSIADAPFTGRASDPISPAPTRRPFPNRSARCPPSRLTQRLEQVQAVPPRILAPPSPPPRPRPRPHPLLPVFDVANILRLAFLPDSAQRRTALGRIRS
ncbi:hypothetical protein B0H15DRAFT_1001230 [Mycena belliarum]|uniref:Uncharacterized protein n=1 Tax=Mycena belliarum TaxID=1033014 RepID=A0AAD6XLG1_9AGAR|nr:hypothetical protein B0H15DRAFT_1001230 [Mycena belliae]